MIHQTDNLSHVLRQTIAIYGVDFKKAIRDQFGISKPTLERWINGESSPAYPVDRIVLAWMNRQLFPPGWREKST